MLILGDIALISNCKEFQIGDKVRSCFKDKNIANLETPLVDGRPEFISDKGVLFGDRSNIDTLLRFNVSYVSLANNHMHDLGLQGLISTMDILDNFGIKHFGAGLNIDEALKPVQVSENIFIAGFCMYNSPTLNNVQVASKTDWGVAGMNEENIQRVLDQIPLDSELIVFVHGGREHVSLPSLHIRNVLKKVIKNSRVKCVVSTHPHRRQPVELIDRKKIFHSLGNFIFPDFVITPPQIISSDLSCYRNVTRQYHPVKYPTLKIWKKINKRFMGVFIDNDNVESRYFKISRRNVVELDTRGLRLLITESFFRLPSRVYSFIVGVNNRVRFLSWYTSIASWKLKNEGLNSALKFIKLLLK